MLFHAFLNFSTYQLFSSCFSVCDKIYRAKLCLSLGTAFISTRSHIASWSYTLDIQQIPASLQIHINSYSLFPICFKSLYYMGPMKTSLNLFCLLPFTPCCVTFSLLSLKIVRIRAKRMIQKCHQWLLSAQWQYGRDALDTLIHLSNDVNFSMDVQKQSLQRFWRAMTRLSALLPRVLRGILRCLCCLCFAWQFHCFVTPFSAFGEVSGPLRVVRQAQMLPALQPREEKTRKIYRLKPFGCKIPHSHYVRLILICHEQSWPCFSILLIRCMCV